MNDIQTLVPVWWFHAWSLLLGLMVGSFLNVVIARLPHGESVVKPRSRCPSCGKLIAWYDNIPVLSFSLLRAKCRHCQKRISFRYPLVELMTGVLFLAAEVRYGWSLSLWIRDWPFLAILVAVTFIDLDHRIIPDPLSLGGLVLGLLTCFLDPRISALQSVIGAALGFGVFFLLAWGYQKYSGKSGLGGGDVKLLAMLGAFLGPSGVFSTILISSVLGSVVGIGWALIKGKKDLMKVSIPYGPFLVVGGLYYYLFGDFTWLQFTTQM
jgi:leader peptidase (prepilin peptidase)/N-methyltransferase